MKKSIKIVWILVAVLVLGGSLFACGNNKNNAEAKSLYTQGLEVIQLMSEMTQSEEYINLYTENDGIKGIVQNIRSGDYTTPKAVYAVSITDENLAKIAELSNLGGVSEGLKSFLTQRIFSSLMVQINSMSGVENLATASVCTIGKTFVNEDVDENVIYLYTYDNAFPVAVTFTVGEGHAVSASGTFIMYDKFTCGSADEIKSFFNYVTVEVTEVPLEK